MLDFYARDAAGLDVAFQVGDAAALPFDDGRFDSVVSLNAMVHFPHWKTVLAEWARVVGPGGRLVFDLYSQDHKDSVQGVLDLSPLENSQASDCVSCVTGQVVSRDLMAWLNRVRVADLVAEASALGLSVRGIVPYGLVFMGVENNLWRLSTLAEGSGWDRMLSWLGMDPRLDAFVLFLERTVTARLTSRFTGSYMVVLERPEPGGAESTQETNAAWLARDAALNAALAGPLTPEALAPFDLGWDAAWQDALNAHLDWPRNRVLFYWLWSGFWDFPGRLDLADYLAPRHAQTLEKWKRNWQMDHTVTQWLHRFIDAPALADQFEWRDTDLRAGLEYELTRKVLYHHFKAFQP